jgi:hypothetical protein
MPYFPPASTGGGATTTASNLGAGSPVFSSVTGNNLAFRSLVAGSAITLTITANEITIASTGGVGPTGPAGAITNLTGSSNIIMDVSAGVYSPRLVTTPTVDAFAMANLGSPPSNPSSGYQWVYVTAGGAGLFNNSAQSYQILDGWRGYLTTATTTSSTTYASTGLVSATLAVGFYQIQVAGAFTSNTTASGVGYRLANENATIGEVFIRWGVRQAADGTDTFYEYSQLATTTNITSLSVVAAATKYPFVAQGWFNLTARGSVRLEHRSEVGTLSNATTTTGTSMLITRIG